MDLIEKNMILKTTSSLQTGGKETLLNYGDIDATNHILNGVITSSSPFTFTVLGDNEQLIPIKYSISQNPHIISVNSQFTTKHVSKFQLKLEGTDFDINVKLWKPYPISPVLP
jgi:hypothetical protein